MAGNQACSCSPRSCRNILWTAISYLPISSGQRREIREAAQNIVQNAEYRMQKSEAGSQESYGLGTVKTANPQRHRPHQRRYKRMAIAGRSAPSAPGNGS